MFLHELAGEEEHVGMSSESSPQREPQALTEERDGVDSGWEDVATLERPNEPDHPPPKHVILLACYLACNLHEQ